MSNFLTPQLYLLPICLTVKCELHGRICHTVAMAFVLFQHPWPEKVMHTSPDLADSHIPIIQSTHAFLRGAVEVGSPFLESLA